MSIWKSVHGSPKAKTSIPTNNGTSTVSIWCSTPLEAITSTWTRLEFSVNGFDIEIPRFISWMVMISSLSIRYVSPSTNSVDHRRNPFGFGTVTCNANRFRKCNIHGGDNNIVQSFAWNIWKASFVGAKNVELQSVIHQKDSSNAATWNASANVVKPGSVPIISTIDGNCCCCCCSIRWPSQYLELLLLVVVLHSRATAAQRTMHCTMVEIEL